MSIEADASGGIVGDRERILGGGERNDLTGPDTHRDVLVLAKAGDSGAAGKLRGTQYGGRKEGEVLESWFHVYWEFNEFSGKL